MKTRPREDNCCIPKGAGTRHAIIRGHGRCQRPSGSHSKHIAAWSGPHIGIQSFDFNGHLIKYLTRLTIASCLHWSAVGIGIGI